MGVAEEDEGPSKLEGEEGKAPGFGFCAGPAKVSEGGEGAEELNELELALREVLHDKAEAKAVDFVATEEGEIDGGGQRWDMGVEGGDVSGGAGGGGRGGVGSGWRAREAGSGGSIEGGAEGGRRGKCDGTLAGVD